MQPLGGCKPWLYLGLLGNFRILQYLNCTKTTVTYLGLGCGLHVGIGNNCGKTHKTYHLNHFKVYSPAALMTFTMSYNHHHYLVPNFLITLKGSLMPIRQPL